MLTCSEVGNSKGVEGDVINSLVTGHPILAEPADKATSPKLLDIIAAMAALEQLSKWRSILDPTAIPCYIISHLESKTGYRLTHQPCARFPLASHQKVLQQ